MADFAWLLPHLDERAASNTDNALFHVLSSHAGPFEVRSGAGTATQVLHLSERTTFGGRAIHGGSVKLTGLAPNSVYDVELSPAGVRSVADRARIRTFPEDIGGEKNPFRLFIGSCFSRSTASEDGNNVLGLHDLLRADPPHLKILCGDQVYLDIPVAERIPHDQAAMQRFVLDKYLTNWGELGRGSSGFGDLLRTGSSLFTCDDHEFWNNYPNAAIYAPSLYDATRRQTFSDSAQRALKLFQRIPPSIRVVKLGRGANRLTLITLDGRLYRSASRAHRSDDLKLLASTLRTCPGPALIVLSQPLLDSAHNSRIKRWFATHVMDLHLADFADYRELVAAIAACPHDVCVLSGDIHGGRITAQSGARHTLYEVITSPLSLVGPSKQWGGALPENEYPDLEGTHEKYRPAGQPRCGPIQHNQGALLSLSRIGRDYRVYVRYIAPSSGRDLLPDPVKTTFTLRSQS
jgi:hypothetical protein